MISVSHDVTEMKKAEKLTQIQQIFDSLPQIMFAKDPNGEVVYSNLLFKKFAKTSPWCSNFLSLVYPEDKKLYSRAWEKSLATNCNFSEKFRLWSEEHQSFRWFQGHGFPYFNSYRKLIYWIKTLSEIHDQKLAEDAAAHLAAIVAHSLDAIIGKDLQGNVTSWNKGAENLFGYSAQEMIGQSILQIFDKDNRNEEKFLLDRISNNQKVENYETRRRRKDGTLVDVSISLSPIKNSKGEIIGVAKIARDISKQKSVERERARLEISERTAQQTSQLKSEFLASMSHEIRTPLNGIIGIADLLNQTPLKTLQKDYVDTILESSNHLQLVINNILDLAKIEANKMEIENVAFDLPDLLNGVKRLMNHSAEQKGIRLQFHPVTQGFQFVKGDPLRLRQILINLIQNAIKFTPYGEINVHTRIISSGFTRRLKIEVIDDGIGIDQSMTESVFDPFVQGEIPPTGRLGGTGLGLSICKKLVTLMRGEIGVDSHPSEGSNFYFSFPIQVQDKEQQSSQLNTFSLKAQKSKLILVAEDNSVNQKVVHQMLDLFGHQTIMVANGLEAIEQVEKRRFDLVLMDCHMPVLDGVSATKKIRNLKTVRSQVPILALTADVLPETKKNCVDAGMNGFLSKPIEAATLFRAIENSDFQSFNPEISNSSPPILDVQVLRKLEILNPPGDFSFTIDLIMDFLKKAPNQLVEVENFLKNNCPREASERAHYLKSVSATVGASQFSLIMAELEQCEERIDSPLELQRKAYDHFEEAKKALLVYIKGLGSNNPD